MDSTEILVGENKSVQSYGSMLETIPQFQTVNFKKSFRALHTFLLLTAISMATLWIQTSVSLYIPLFSDVAMKKGLSDTEIGLIMGISPFVSFLIYPFVNVFVNANNFKFTFALSGIYLSGSVTLFGLIAKMDRISFEVFAFVFQILQAFALSLLFLVSYAIMLRIFPKYRTFLISISEIIIGLGYMTGPPLGGLLFDRFGFTLMFFGAGTISFILVSVSVCILLPYALSTDTFEDEGKQDYFLAIRILGQFDLLFLFVLVLVAATSFNYFIPVLGPFMFDKYQMNPGGVGFIFLSANAVYVLMAPIMGFVTSKIHYLTPFIVVGFIIQSIGTLLVPPSNLVVDVLHSAVNGTGTMNLVLVSPYVGMCLIGFGYILSYLPLLTELMNRTDKKFPVTANVTTTITSIYVSVYYLGEGCGPLVAGFVAQYFTLDVVVVYISGVIVFFAILTCLFILFNFYNFVKRKCLLFSDYETIN